MPLVICACLYLCFSFLTYFPENTAAPLNHCFLLTHQGNGALAVACFKISFDGNYVEGI